MMEKRRQVIPGKDLTAWAWFFAPSALLLIPFVRFVKSNSYPMLTPEVLLVGMGFMVAGCVLGLVGRLGVMFRAFGFASALTLLIDIQTDWFFEYSLHQYAWLPIGLYVVFLISPVFVRKFALVAVFAMFAATLATPGSEPIQVGEANEASSGEMDKSAGENANTVWIHIIVDEQIGIESIPIEFDPERILADQLVDDYISGGFVVFGRAFTRFSQTHLSIPNILNFAARHPRHFITDDAEPSMSITKSEYFQRLRRQGYGVHIYSMDYLRLCGVDGDEWANVCNIYGANSIWGLRESSLSTLEKTLLIMRIYTRLSKVYLKTVGALDLDRRLSLPKSVATLVAARVFEHFRSRVLTAQPGTAWILHLPLPHEPYVFERDCSVKSIPWLENGLESEAYQINSAESRRARYLEYLEQVECVNKLLQDFFEDLRDAGIYDRASIVVHGDHGSRIASHNLKERPYYRPDFRPSAETMMDYYGTLFAYKPPKSGVGEYRREVRSVGELLDTASSGGLDWGVGAEDPVAYLVEWNNEVCKNNESDNIEGCRLLPFRMPAFSHGELSEEAADSSDSSSIP